MSDLERLNIVLAARDREFASAMERNQRRVEQFARKSQSNLSKTSKSFDALAYAGKRLAPIMAAVGAGAMVRNLQRTVAALDDIGKTADKMGLTTDALQELRTIAESSGIAQGSLDSSLERFSKRLGEAQQGTGAAKKALDDLGLSAAALAKMGLDNALSVVADKMAAIPDPTERAATAAALFGREGVAMVNLLREGSAGMAEMRREAHELGIIIDESLIRNAEEAQTKLDLMSRVISAQLSSAIINLAPLLVGASEKIAALARAANDLLNVNFDLPALRGAEELTAEAAALQGLQGEWQAVHAARANYQANVDKFGQDSTQAAKWADNLERAEKAYSAAAAAKKAAAEAEDRAVAGIEDLFARTAAAKEQARLNGLSAEAAERERIAKEKTALAERTLADILAAQDGFISNTQRADVAALVENWAKAEASASRVLNPPSTGGGGGGAMRVARAEALDYAEVLARVEELTGGASLQGAGFARVMAELRGLFQSGAIDGGQFASMVDEIEGKFGDASSAAARLESTATSTFANIVTGAESARDALSNLLSEFAGMFANAAFGGILKDSGVMDSIGELLSYDGGGHTGSGPRSGGLDGKGGFLAILHPDETVTDHTKGQTLPAASGGVSGNATAGARPAPRRMIAPPAPPRAPGGALSTSMGQFDSLGGLLSFEGGGFTGRGARSGGLDNKGGFLAMVHPNESIIDHTAGQGARAATSAAGGGDVAINIQVSGARGNSEITEMVQSGVRQGLQEYDRSVLPRSVQKINKDPRRIG